MSPTIANRARPSRRVALVLAAVLAAAAPAAFGAEAPKAKARVGVFVSIPPQAQFAERVGGEHVEVNVLVGTGQSPHTFEPTPKQMADLARADLYFSIGLPMETRLLQKAADINPRLRVIDTQQGIPLRRMTEAEGHHHEGGDEPPAAPAGDADGHHDVGRPDPHVWLNPRYVKIQAAAICGGLRAVDPPHAAEYEANLRAFQDDLDIVDAAIARTLAPLKGREFLVFHPAFGYFGDAYGLKQVAVEIEGKEPGARQLAALIDRARASGIKVIFVQPQFSRHSAEAVARAIGGAVVPMDPLARDYLENLRRLAEALRQALAPTP